jgi:hypothetical protein
MDMNRDFYRSLPERIENEFIEIDSDICTELRKRDEGYAALFKESHSLQAGYPAIMDAVEGEGEVHLTAEEHAALVRYFEVKWKMENVERRHIYFRGHTDNFAYLKRVGAV